MMTSRTVMLALLVLVITGSTVLFLLPPKDPPPVGISSAETSPSPATEIEVPVHRNLAPAAVSTASSPEGTGLPSDFEKTLRDVFSGGSVNLFDVYISGRESSDLTKRFLAFRVYDVCMPYVRRTTYPAANNFPDGDSMRRSTAIQFLMNRRCAAFSMENISEFVAHGKRLSDQQYVRYHVRRARLM